MDADTPISQSSYCGMLLYILTQNKLNCAHLHVEDDTQAPLMHAKQSTDDMSESLTSIGFIQHSNITTSLVAYLFDNVTTSVLIMIL